MGGSYKNGDYRKRMGCYGLDSSGYGQGQVMGCCEHGHEPPGSTILEKRLELAGEVMVEYST
jgi:hypothetical protein